MLIYGETVRKSFKGEKKLIKKKIAFCCHLILSHIGHCCIHVVIKEFVL